MSVLVLKNRTPSIYSKESRDYQLFTRLYDCITNGVSFDADTITDIINTRNCRSNILPLLQTKLGFYTIKKYDDDSIRCVLDAFPLMVKNKGSKKGIEYAVNVFVKINHLTSPVTVTLQKNSTTLYNGYVVPDHTVVIGIYSSIQDTSILEEMFRYILPAGLGYYFYFYNNVSELTNLLMDDNAEVLLISDNINSQVRSYMTDGSIKSFDEYNWSDEFHRLVGAVDTTQFISDYFGELGDVIPTTDDTYSAGDDNLFLGVHFDENKTLTEYLSEHTEIVSSVGNYIVFNYKQYIKTTSSVWTEMTYYGRCSDLSDVENPQDYTIALLNNGTTINDVYYIYLNSQWSVSDYPLYLFKQSSED